MKQGWNWNQNKHLHFLCTQLTDSKSKTLIRIQPKKIYFTLLQWRMMEKSKKLVREKEDCCCSLLSWLLEGGCGIGWIISELAFLILFTSIFTIVSTIHSTYIVKILTRKKWIECSLKMDLIQLLGTSTLAVWHSVKLLCCFFRLLNLVDLHFKWISGEFQLIV